MTYWRGSAGRRDRRQLNLHAASPSAPALPGERGGRQEQRLLDESSIDGEVVRDIGKGTVTVIVAKPGLDIGSWVVGIDRRFFPVLR